MSGSGHVDSYYAASLSPGPDFPALEGDRKVDVGIVGGGLTGCAAALALSERGFSVALLEARRIGWGASGRNGGQALVGFAPDLARIERLVGPDDARRLWRSSLEAVQMIADNVARHAIACDFRRGHVSAMLKAQAVREARAAVARLAERYDYHQRELLDRAALTRLVATPRYAGGVLDRCSGHLHPLNYCRGLAAAARAAGASLFEASPVRQIRIGAAAKAVTDRGVVSARFLVLAGNAYLGGLAPAIRPRIMPVATFMVATAPLAPARARALIPGDVAVTDDRFVLDYYRLSADHRLLFGAGASYSTLTPPALRQHMAARIKRVFPQLDPVPIEHVWSGLVDISRNRLPDLGRISANVYYAQGFSGQGVALTGLAGRIIAEAIAGQAERFDLFARIPHKKFHGGRALRLPLLVLSMLWYRMRDFF